PVLLAPRPTGEHRVLAQGLHEPFHVLLLLSPLGAGIMPWLAGADSKWPLFRWRRPHPEANLRAGDARAIGGEEIRRDQHAALVALDDARRRMKLAERRRAMEAGIEPHRQRLHAGAEAGMHRIGGCRIEHRRQEAAVDGAVAVGELVARGEAHADFPRPG